MANRKKIVVKLDRQVLFAYEGGTLVHTFDCVSGDEDHPTDPGAFTVWEKRETYTSRKYKRPMNHALFFSKDRKAIHEAYAVGISSYLKSFGIDSIGSHGCVRLSTDDAKTMFAWAPVGTTVLIEKA